MIDPKEKSKIKTTINNAAEENEWNTDDVDFTSSLWLNIDNDDDDFDEELANILNSY